MAAASRTTLLRQSQLLTSSCRGFSSTTQPLRILRTAPSLSSRPLLATKWSPVSRVAPFSTTAQKKILPAGPQVIQGGVNDPAPVPKPDPLHGSYHWTFERLLSVGLVPLTIAPFAAGSISPALDAALIFSIIVHSHMGFQSIVIDYIPINKHPTARKAFMWLLNLATVVVAIGFYEFETNDVGVTEAIKRIWHAGANDATIGKTDVSALGHDGKLKHLK
ncbi:membrane anchor subunit of succinate dehydrogenase, Sdh4 [Exophiala dermatitidis]|uniref:Succinate dehydrogenase [ubiquinone] cytochrome b small subunit n=2 Tax=Exophiala dermatitidis TaxID=5970 RepID=H6BTJ1_EXODN|nr:succinate dehydrogenase (ubiquinone) membrane anchor subunit [Exophiala dermatitidis NIH/UT8656]KAJ4501913.1 membrane anchor subunit of succinate dehydrogenase, Sdh4 [Exophiala dermatitidis]EHY55418.1 succinate dehydrogenase (ubiquinone) membrane anchor subunit [Exophiala dermatitidis NIH/UT8656]KAJ4502178.1 membrane anchor subunit of succinate dehydrogenase, Sdh4 [Exophiala dermatitidis]KAJ4502421.1 membrane anchor subunit of succinate dehydrogenase, Sdh4 [Exophiala dermatitidis]KAJ4530300